MKKLILLVLMVSVTLFLAVPAIAERAIRQKITPGTNLKDMISSGGTTQVNNIPASGGGTLTRQKINSGGSPQRLRDMFGAGKGQANNSGSNTLKQQKVGPGTNKQLLKTGGSITTAQRGYKLPSGGNSKLLKK